MLKSVAGRQVPFNPRQFPTRLSKRIGLRTMGSIGAKAPCPSGEQLVNGGFETGDFTGWENVGPNNAIDFAIKHSGLYSCWVYCSTPNEGYIRQTFSGVKRSCIATFEFWHRTIGFGQESRTTIEYGDGTSTDVDLGTASSTWEYVNLLPYVEAGKTVTGIKFSHNAVMSPYCYFDDVSLIGAG